MDKLNKDDIIVISQYSDISEKTLKQTLEKSVYNDRLAWLKLLRYGLLALGIGFTIVGIVFFFAYNWASLPKFAKIGLVQVLLIASVLLSLLLKVRADTRNMILTASAALVGVLFAVFGQIYQTGANAYDFFLAWTVFISLWVVISNYAPLNLLYILLINTTFILYSQQVAPDWSFTFVNSLLFLLNTGFAAAMLGLPLTCKALSQPNWLIYIVALAAVSFATLAMVNTITQEQDPHAIYMSGLYISLFAVSVALALRYKKTYYLAIIGFSLIIVGTALLLKISDSEGMLLFMSFYIVATVSLLVKALLYMQNKWKDEK